MPHHRPHPAKTLIVARGESIKSVAIAIGIGESSLYGVLSGHVAPWPALTDKLTAYLGVDADELWHDDRGLADAARKLVESTRRSQGLPATVTDEAVLDRVAALVAQAGAA